MSAVIRAIDWLENTAQPTNAPAATLAPMVVIFGSDPFLRFHALRRLLNVANVDFDAAQSYDGPECQWRDVHDELATLSLFDDVPQRVAIIREADKFVSANRPALERWLDSPPPDAILVLEVNSFPGTTKLYKQVANKGMLIECSPPVTSGYGNPVDERAVVQWITRWAKQRHHLLLIETQAIFLLDRTGAEFGIIDGELAKLALFADEAGRVTDEHLQEMVGGWRSQTIWKIAEFVASGKAALAIEQLDRLFVSGQTALGIFAPLSWSLRRFGVAAHLIEQAERNGSRLALPMALEKAGFRKGEVTLAEKQLRRIGRQRGKQLLTWLVELELQLKGSHSSEHLAKYALETLVLRLA